MSPYRWNEVAFIVPNKCLTNRDETRKRERERGERERRSEIAAIYRD